MILNDACATTPMRLCLSNLLDRSEIATPFAEDLFLSFYYRYLYHVNKRKGIYRAYRVMRLRFVKKMTYHKIGKLVGCTGSRVRSIIFQESHYYLKKYLNKDFSTAAVECEYVNVFSYDEKEDKIKIKRLIKTAVTNEFGFLDYVYDDPYFYSDECQEDMAKEARSEAKYKARMEKYFFDKTGYKTEQEAIDARQEAIRNDPTHPYWSTFRGF